MNDGPVIEKLLREIEGRVYVDIGCSCECNLPQDLIQEGRKTLFFDLDREKSSRWRQSDNFKVFNEKITPINVGERVVSRLDGEDITFLDIDIDGYDYFVLDELLKLTKPYLIVAEINEKIPPPIKFTVNFSESYAWDTSHCFGMSISKFNELAEKYGYDLIELTCNNIYAIRKDKNKFKSYTAEELFETKYKNRRLAGELPEFYYNGNVDCLLTMETESAMTFIRNIFSGKDFELTI